MTIAELVKALADGEHVLLVKTTSGTPRLSTTPAELLARVRAVATVDENGHACVWKDSYGAFQR